jgi:hypothetical protein
MLSQRADCVAAGNVNPERVAETRKLNQDGYPGFIAKVSRHLAAVGRHLAAGRAASQGAPQARQLAASQVCPQAKDHMANGRRPIRRPTHDRPIAGNPRRRLERTN